MWKVPEHEHTHKDPDWFWGIGVIVTSIAVVSIFMGNPLFAILIILGAITLFMHAIKKPEIITVKISEAGLSIGDTLFPYEELVSFFVTKSDARSFVIVKSKKVLTPRIMVPLDTKHEDDARRALAVRLREEKLEVPISHQLLEFFGL